MAINPVFITQISEKKLKSFDCGDDEYATYSNDEVLHVVPAVEIARFAIATAYQGRFCEEEGEKYSDYVLSQTLQDIMDLREYALGVRAVVLFSVNRPKQLHFYKKNGFNVLSEQHIFQSTENDGCIPMYMPLPQSNTDM